MNTDLSLSSIRSIEELYADPPAAYLDPDSWDFRPVAAVGLMAFGH